MSIKDLLRERKMIKDAKKAGYEATYTKAKEAKFEKKLEAAYAKGKQHAEAKAEGKRFSIPKPNPAKIEALKRAGKKFAEKGATASERMQKGEHLRIQQLPGMQLPKKPPSPTFTGKQRPGSYPPMRKRQSL